MKRECSRVMIPTLLTLVVLPCVAVGDDAVVRFGDGQHGRRPSRSALIEERDAGDAVVREIVHAQGTPLWQIRSDGSSQYFHEDPRGNIVALTEGAGPPTTSIGDVLERYSYDAYGKPLFQNAANVNKLEPGAGTFVRRSDFGNTLLFQGMVYDPETDSRGTSFNNDFGGLYCSGGRYLDSDDGRTMTRSEVKSDPGFGIVAPGFHDSGEEANRYAFAFHAPVNLTGASSGMPQTREHILLGRQVGVPLKVEMKRVMVTSVSAGGGSSGKDKATPNLMQYCTGGKHSGGHRSGRIWTDYNSHDPGGPSLPPTLDSPEPEPIPAGVEHEDIGGGDIALPCACVMVPVPCGSCPSGFDSVMSCSSGCGLGGRPSGPSLSVNPGGSAPSEPQTPRGCVCIVVPIPCPSCPGGFDTQVFCGGVCVGGGGGDDVLW